MSALALSVAVALAGTSAPLTLQPPMTAAPRVEAQGATGETGLIAPKLAAPKVAQVYIPPPAPVVYVDPGLRLLFLGIGLVAAGLVLGGAGFALLYYCQQGTPCYNNTTQTVGWVIAIPGVIPLAIGAVMIRIAIGRRYAEAPSPRPRWQFALAPTPLRGGGGLALRSWF